MIALTKFHCLTASTLLLVFTPIVSSSASEPPTPPKARSLAKLYPNGTRARDVMGMSVRSSAGEDLGKLKDLVIDPRSGRIVYGIVSSGGVLGVGDTQRAVPFSAFRYATDDHDSLKIDLALADWQRAPLYNSDHFASLADQERSDYIYRYYHQSWEPLGGPSDSSSDTARALRLELASSLIGREVRSGSRKIGEAEDLIVNVGSRRAQLLLRPESTFAGTSDHFVIPFNKLTPRNSVSDTVATTLTRDDFSAVKEFDQQAWSDSASNSIYRWKIADPTS